MKLGKLQMPKKKSKMMDDYSFMDETPASDSGDSADNSGDLTGESEGETGREPSPEEEAAEGEPASGPDLGDVSDDELMAELKKRGLSAKLK